MLGRWHPVSNNTGITLAQTPSQDSSPKPQHLLSTRTFCTTARKVLDHRLPLLPFLIDLWGTSSGAICQQLSALLRRLRVAGAGREPSTVLAYCDRLPTPTGTRYDNKRAKRTPCFIPPRHTAQAANKEVFHHLRLSSFTLLKYSHLGQVIVASSMGIT